MTAIVTLIDEHNKILVKNLKLTPYAIDWRADESGRAYQDFVFTIHYCQYVKDGKNVYYDE